MYAQIFNIWSTTAATTTTVMVPNDVRDNRRNSSRRTDYESRDKKGAMNPIYTPKRVRVAVNIVLTSLAERARL